MAVTRGQLLSMLSTTTRTASQFTTWQRSVHYCSAVSQPKCFVRVCCMFVVSGLLQQHAFCLSFSLCPSPALFHLPQHTEGCFLSLVLGSDLITYLFSLSYSKLLWLRVLLRTEIFLPPPPPVSIPSSLSLCPSLPHPPLTDIVRTLLIYFFTQVFLHFI